MASMCENCKSTEQLIYHINLGDHFGALCRVCVLRLAKEMLDKVYLFDSEQATAACANPEEKA